MSSLDRIREGLDRAGQSHVLQFWPELSEEERQAFLQQLSLLDLAGLRAHCEGAVKAAQSSTGRVDQNMEPIPADSIGSVNKSDVNSLNAWENEGLLQISQNRVGALLLAGGQGTRLGVQYPKGMYKVGLPSGKSLYQIQAERIQKIQRLADSKFGSKSSVPWYIMTSEFTLTPTQNFFKDNNYFGLSPSNVVLFEQKMIPVVSLDGKLVLENKGKLAMAPDGNGGLYQALEENKVLEDMKKRGVDFLHVYCVDNILVKMADPLFIGFCVSKGAECGAKVVEKVRPTEPVGVVCRVKGVYQVVEYSEIQESTAELRGPGGELVYSAGNICIHFFTRAFLEDVAQNHVTKMTQHVAKKKVPCVDKCGNLVKPTAPNGIKMEKFVFDVFTFSRNLVVFEVTREDEFSPLKNADSAATDSPTTARNSLLSQHCRWAAAAGASVLDRHGNVLPNPVSGSSADEPSTQLEISPLVSYFGEGLEQLEGKTLQTPLFLDEEKAKELLAQ